jgi:hypothetical protein
MCFPTYALPSCCNIMQLVTRIALHGSIVFNERPMLLCKAIRYTCLA